MNITDLIKQFSRLYKKEVLKPHSKELMSYKVLVNQLPLKISEITSFVSEDFILKGSIGSGVNTYYPWFGIFDKRVSSGATNGFYLVLLFSNDFNDIYLTFNQGATIQSQTLIESNRNFVYTLYYKIDGFEKGQLPEESLVKIKTDSSSKNGKKYQETNIFYKKYEINELDEKIFLNDFNKLLNIYIDCADKFINKIPFIEVNHFVEFDFKYFYKRTEQAGLIFSPQLIQRFIASLCTKPFVICSGLSGSGKTKLAQAFAQWICYKEAEGEKNEQYCIVPVGADWTNREPLLGYPNALQESNYIKPENGVLDLINRARLNETKPYFLILDEMNLSHVERYFADFLSTMESGDAIPLHTIEDEENGIPKQINLPKNLFIIGTVNIDETTYMFSPKVLDRANTIEFRLTENDLKEFIASDVKLDMDLLKGEGAGMGESFVAMATQKTDKNLKEVEEDLLKFFKELKKSGTEFGYRSASEMGRLMFMLKTLGEKGDNLLDIAIMQKLLPKLHGSRNKLTKVLPVLGSFCLIKDIDKIKEDYLEKFVNNTFSEEELRKDKNIKYPISFEKICRMYKNAVENGFASYAEA